MKRGPKANLSGTMRPCHAAHSVIDAIVTFQENLMLNPHNRRQFLSNAAVTTAAAGVSLSALRTRADSSPNHRVVVGVMGLNRGQYLVSGFAKQPNVEVKYVCDVDSTRIGPVAKQLETETGKAPQGLGDFRRILDDKEVDVLVCAAPNHWHAPATILACAAGKHAYVEKPCSHNPREGELMVAAARKHNRAVQVGSQRRSAEGWIEAIERLHQGVIGRVFLARSWFAKARGSIGTGVPAAVPPHIDYELWQGPAPRRPYLSNILHYNWHWRWHWGNGELGNNGVHGLDLCRWGMDVDYPIRVTSSGGRYHWQDDQETPDTHTVCFEFPGNRQITWAGLSSTRHGGRFIEFYGDSGTMEVDSSGSYVLFDKGDKKVEERKTSPLNDAPHFANLLAAIRNDTPLELNTEIEKAHKSALLCHLGNIAHRTGRTLNCNDANGHIRDDEDAMKLWGREYQPGWEPNV